MDGNDSGAVQYRMSLPPPAQPSPAHTRSPAIAPQAERRGSRVVKGWSKRRVHRWRSPLLMICFFLLGFAMSIAHCVFYPKLRGRVVGDSDQQEEKIRFGTAFAFLAQICLGASVWTAYTQWMWRTVKKRTLTIDAWNCAFSADTSIFSLLNLEMLRKLRLGSAMAFFAWSLLLPPFFTPATLFIYGDTDVVQTSTWMPYPAIANASEAHRFSYSPPVRRGTTQNLNDKSRVFTGPRTVLSLTTTAASSLGEILPLDLPYNNSAYSISFFAPIVKCADADETQALRILRLLEEDKATTFEDRQETDSAYFGFVPTYSDGNLTAVWQARQQTTSKPLNELWMTFLRPEINSNGERVKLRHYQICKPYNASYDLEISQYHGIQTVSRNYTIHEAIPFPIDSPEKTSNMTQHAYAAFMWTFCDQLVGKFAWWNRTIENPTTSQTAAQFGVIDSPIQRTSLLGSRDLDAFYEMDEEKALYENQRNNSMFDLSDQRLRDKALAGNRTLDVLIEELSFNMTVPRSCASSNSRLVPVNLTNDVNRYSYKPYGLFIPYALANIFTFVCVAIGIISFARDGVLPGRKVQDVIWAARRGFELGDESDEILEAEEGRTESGVGLVVRRDVMTKRDVAITGAEQQRNEGIFREDEVEI